MTPVERSSIYERKIFRSLRYVRRGQSSQSTTTAQEEVRTYNTTQIRSFIENGDPITLKVDKSTEKDFDEIAVNVCIYGYLQSLRKYVRRNSSIQ